MNEIKNYGLIIEPQVPEDFVFGSEKSLMTRFKGRKPLKENGDWTLDLPIIEPQSTNITETNGCVSFGTLNAIEMMRKFVFSINENLSDRMVAKGSGTDPGSGNTPKKVGQWLRKHWTVLEKEYPFPEDMSVEEFYADLPEDLVSIATGRGAEYDFGYERVGKSIIEMREALKYSPLGMSVPAWVQDEDGIYYRPEGMSDNHWIVCFAMKQNGNKMIFDSYFPFIKEVRADCVPSVIIGYYLNRQIVNENAWMKFIQILLNIFSKKTPELSTEEIVITPTLSGRIREITEASLGIDVSPKNLAPQELSCAEGVSAIIHQAINDFQQDILSTANLDDELEDSSDFEITKIPKPGCIVVSPRTKAVNGHTGIFLTSTRIASNNSPTGLFEDNYSLDAWIKTFGYDGRGLETRIYEPVGNIRGIN